MQLQNLGDSVLVCHEADGSLLESTALSGAKPVKFHGIWLFDMSAQSLEITIILGDIPGFTMRRYLDRFYLWTPEFDERHRQEVLDRFFEMLAGQYESLIDTARNLNNIQNLLGFLRQHDKLCNAPVILDYGCGTGLSLELAKEFGINPIGFDRCPTMRQLATNRGMRVWSPSELAGQPHNSVDGAFASYVFHLLPHPHGLRLLWARLKLGGVIVSNFHKHQGIELVNSCVQELGGAVRTIPNPIGSDRHGAYFAYLKDH